MVKFNNNYVTICCKPPLNVHVEHLRQIENACVGQNGIQIEI